MKSLLHRRSEEKGKKSIMELMFLLILVSFLVPQLLIVSNHHKKLPLTDHHNLFQKDDSKRFDKHYVDKDSHISTTNDSSILQEGEASSNEVVSKAQSISIKIGEEIAAMGEQQRQALLGLGSQLTKEHKVIEELHNAEKRRIAEEQTTAEEQQQPQNEVHNVPLNDNEQLFIEDKYENNHKPKLFLHVGPRKTGTTSIQMNVLKNKKISRHLTKSDNFQMIDFYSMGRIFNECFSKGPDGCNYNAWNEMAIEYEKAYNVTQVSNAATTEATIMNTVHSSEDMSSIPENDLAFSLLKGLLERWDVHIVIFYRPFTDWLPSMYSQFRKYSIARPRDPKHPYKQDYAVDRYETLFPQYLEDTKITLRDSLSTYQFFEKVLVHLDYTNTTQNIHIMQTYSPDGIEREFICKLPTATNSCQHISKLKNYKGKNQNGSLKLNLNIDLIIVEAWNQKLINIPRHDAAVLLEEKMKETNITMKDLPLKCISAEQEEWIWNRTVLTEEIMFGPRSISEKELLRQKFENSLQEKKYCSVDAAAALGGTNFRNLFNSCAFQSPTLVNRAGKRTKKKVNKIWKDLGCT